MRHPILVLLSMLMTTSVLAVTPEKIAKTLHIRQESQNYFICDLECAPAASPAGHLAPEIRLVMNTGESIEVWIDDPNPLLFTYKFGGIEQVKNPDVAAIEVFTTALSSAGEALQGAGKAVGENSGHATSPAPLLDPDLTDRMMIEKRQRDFGFRGQSAAQARVENYKKRFSGVKPEEAKKLTQQGISDEFLSALGAAISNVADARKKMADLVNSSADPDEWPAIKQTVKEWDLKTVGKTVRDGYAKLDEAHNRFKITDTTEIAPAVQNALAVRSDVLTYLGELEKFQVAIEGLGKPVLIAKDDGTPAVLDFDILNDQKYTVNIAAVSKEKGFTPGIADSFKTRKIPEKQDIVFFATPYHNARITAATAVVYSFVRQPEFTADKQGNDLVIKQTHKDRFAGQDVGVMMNIVPASWDKAFIGGAFQLGLTPVKDRFAFYAGSGLMVKKYFYLGVGGVFQRVDRLANGQKVGDVVAKAEDIKTDKHFKAGVYVHMSVEFKNPLKK